MKNVTTNFIVLLIVIFMLAVSASSYAQNNFKRTYRPAGQTVAAFSTISASGGGYYMTGHLFDLAGPLNPDIYILKVDQDGNPLWWKRYDAGSVEQQCSVVELPSGDLIIKFTYDPSPAIDTAYTGVARIDSSGSVVWVKTFFPGKLGWTGNVTLNKNNGNILIPAKLDVYVDPLNTGTEKLGLIEMDLSGNFVRSYAVGYPSHAGAGFEQTSDGGFVFSGGDNSTTNYVGFAGKMDSAGNLEWGFRGPTNYPFCTGTITELPDGTFAWIFNENCYLSPAHRGIVKISATGNIISAKEIFAQPGDTTLSLLPTLYKSEDGSLFLDWVKFSSSIGKRIMIPMDTSLNFQTGKLFDFSPFRSDTKVIKVNGNELIMGGGHTGSPGYTAALYRTSLISNTLCGESNYTITTAPYTVVAGFNPFVYDTIVVSPLPAISLTVSNVSGDSLLCQTSGLQEFKDQQNMFSIAPNPANQSAVISLQSAENNNRELKIFSLMGKEIFKSLVNSHQLSVDVSKLENGIYFVQLQTENKFVTQKLIVQH